MDAYTTEEQQWEAIKNFFKKYGNTLLWSAILVLGCISAYRYWEHHQFVQAVDASETYAELLISLDQNDAVAVNTKTQTLQDKYTKSTYATLASMISAKLAFKDGQIDKAKQDLQWAIEHSKHDDLTRLAQFRLMKLYMLEQNFDKALDIANQDKNGLMPLFKALEGDIYAQKQDQALAKQAYQAAFNATKDSPGSLMLRLKLEDLGVEVQ